MYSRSSKSQFRVRSICLSHAVFPQTLSFSDEWFCFASALSRLLLAPPTVYIVPQPDPACNPHVVLLRSTRHRHQVKQPHMPLDEQAEVSAARLGVRPPRRVASTQFVIFNTLGDSSARDVSLTEADPSLSTLLASPASCPLRTYLQVHDQSGDVRSGHIQLMVLTITIPWSARTLSSMSEAAAWRVSVSTQPFLDSKMVRVRSRV